jgi:hypothetical protein
MRESLPGIVFADSNSTVMGKIAERHKRGWVAIST